MNQYTQRAVRIRTLERQRTPGQNRIAEGRATVSRLLNLMASYRRHVQNPESVQDRAAALAGWVSAHERLERAIAYGSPRNPACTAYERAQVRNRLP